MANQSLVNGNTNQAPHSKEIDTVWTDKAGLLLESASSLLSVLHDAIERNLITPEERKAMIDAIMELLDSSYKALISESKNHWATFVVKIQNIIVGLKVLKITAEISSHQIQASSAFALGFLVDETLSSLEAFVYSFGRSGVAKA